MHRLSRRRFAALAGLSCAGALASCAAAPSPPPSPAPPALQLRVQGGTDVLVLDGQVRAVRVVPDPERHGIALSVDLDAATRAQVARFTGRHTGEHVEIAVAGATVATVLVRDPVDVPALLLTAHDDDEVRRMQRDLDVGGMGAPVASPRK